MKGRDSEGDRVAGRPSSPGPRAPPGGAGGSARRWDQTLSVCPAAAQHRTAGLASLSASQAAPAPPQRVCPSSAEAGPQPCGRSWDCFRHFGSRGRAAGRAPGAGRTRPPSVRPTGRGGVANTWRSREREGARTDAGEAGSQKFTFQSQQVLLFGGIHFHFDPHFRRRSLRGWRRVNPTRERAEKRTFGKDSPFRWGFQFPSERVL